MKNELFRRLNSGPHPVLSGGWHMIVASTKHLPTVTVLGVHQLSHKKLALQLSRSDPQVDKRQATPPKRTSAPKSTHSFCTVLSCSTFRSYSRQRTQWGLMIWLVESRTRIKSQEQVSKERGCQSVTQGPLLAFKLNS